MRRRQLVVVVMMMMVVMIMGFMKVVEGMWCVARSDASDEELQRGLDYACAVGADCNTIQETGLCFLPNTLQAHASYAFNSFYQRSHMSPSSCDFSATATLAKTDPSYGSCVYPASPSTAGSITSTTPNTASSGVYGSGSPLTPTTTSTSPATVDGGADLNPNSMGPPIPTTTDSRAASLANSYTLLLLGMSLFLLLSLLPFF